MTCFNCDDIPGSPYSLDALTLEFEFLPQNESSVITFWDFSSPEYMIPGMYDRAVASPRAWGARK